MDIDRTTIPGTGVVHGFRTRRGVRFGLLSESTGTRHLLMYEPGSDAPAVDIALEPDEADQVAQLMHSRSVSDRLASLEQRLDRLSKKRVDR